MDNILVHVFFNQSLRVLFSYSFLSNAYRIYLRGPKKKKIILSLTIFSIVSYIFIVIKYIKVQYNKMVDITRLFLYSTVNTLQTLLFISILDW